MPPCQLYQFPFLILLLTELLIGGLGSRKQGEHSQEEAQAAHVLMFAFSPPKRLLLGVTGDRMLCCIDS